MMVNTVIITKCARAEDIFTWVSNATATVLIILFDTDVFRSLERRDKDEEAAVAAQEEDVLNSFAQESSNLADATVQDEAAVVATGLNEAQSEELERSTELLGVLENSRKQLMDVGAVHAAGQLEVEIRKETHRVREVSREDPDVLLGLARARVRGSSHMYIVERHRY